MGIRLNYLRINIKDPQASARQDKNLFDGDGELFRQHWWIVWHMAEIPQ